MTLLGLALWFHGSAPFSAIQWPFWIPQFTLKGQQTRKTVIACPDWSILTPLSKPNTIPHILCPAKSRYVMLSARNLQGSWEQDTACANSFPWEAFSSVSVSCADKGLGSTERYTTKHDSGRTTVVVVECQIDVLSCRISCGFQWGTSGAPLASSECPELLGFPRPNICNQSSHEMNRVAHRVENCWNNWAHNVMGRKVTSASTCRESRDSACQGQEECAANPVLSLLWNLQNPSPKCQSTESTVLFLGMRKKDPSKMPYSRFASHSCHIASKFPMISTSNIQLPNIQPQQSRLEPIASCFITASISSNSRRWPLTFTFETTQIFGDVWLLCNSYHLYVWNIMESGINNTAFK